jgi:hypothetical protein
VLVAENISRMKSTIAAASSREEKDFREPTKEH